jgi:hypothetical protein
MQHYCGAGARVTYPLKSQHIRTHQTDAVGVGKKGVSAELFPRQGGGRMRGKSASCSSITHHLVGGGALIMLQTSITARGILRCR